MIPEKMLELIILKMLTDDSAYSWRSDIKNKMFNRLEELLSEFLKPYVTAEKSE